MDPDSFENGADMCRRMKQELKDGFFSVMEQLSPGTHREIRDKVVFDFIIGCEILTASATILDATKNEINADRIYFSIRKYDPNVKIIPSLRIGDKEIFFRYNHQLIPLCLEIPQNSISTPYGFCEKFWKQTRGCEFTLVDLLMTWMVFAGFHNHDDPSFMIWLPPLPSLEKNVVSTEVPVLNDDWEKSSEDETSKGKPTTEEVEKKKREERMEKYNKEKEQQREEHEMDYHRDYDAPAPRERATAEQKSNESALGWLWSTLLRK